MTLLIIWSIAAIGLVLFIGSATKGNNIENHLNEL